MANEALPSMTSTVLYLTNGATGKTTAGAAEETLTAPQSGSTSKWIDLGEFAGGTVHVVARETAGQGATLRAYSSQAGTDATQAQLGSDQTLAASSGVAFNVSATGRYFGLGFLRSGASNCTVLVHVTITKPHK